jgi:hypothetical protein
MLLDCVYLRLFCIVYCLVLFLVLSSLSDLGGGYDRAVKVWDCKSRNYEPMQTLLQAQDSVAAVAISQFEIITGMC